MLLHRFAAILVLFTLSASMFAQTKAFDPARMDTSTLACDNFFQYVNGTWLKNTEIPADRSNYGGFTILADQNNDLLRSILEEAAKTKSPEGSDSQLIGDYYASCMDEASIEAAGLAGIEPAFKKIDGIKDPKSLVATIAYLHRSGVPALFGFGASADLDDSTMNIANTGQGGLTLPNKEYYTKTDAKSVEIRGKFVTYMTNMFQMAGDSAEKAAANAQTVLKLQTRLANASRSPIENRDPKLSKNKMTLVDADKLSPNLNWETYIAERGAPKVTMLNVGNPAFLKEVSAMLGDTPVEDWKVYLRWNVLNSSANALPKKFADENFDFFGKTLSGVKEQQPRWRRCVAATDGTFGEALGMAFIKRINYTPAMKKSTDDLISNLVIALRDRINGLDWMSADTKKQALIKLDAFKRKIGYPDKLRGYAGLKVTRNAYLENNRRAAEFQVARNLKDIGQPVDRSRWGFTPPTVNASYSPQSNTITFPAGISQPPFYSFTADDAFNYGGMGSVIGHEISHGFDDQGSQFDSVGNLKSWWTPDDRKNFEERANCVVEQFNGYEVLPGLHIQGKLTLGENIGDLGGLNIAYEAFEDSLKGKPRPADIDGFTPEQRFFLAWAQVWSSKYRDEAIRQQVLGNPHADPRYRVNGPLSNMPEFAQAFGCKLPDKMVSTHPCKIW
jgi:predicted metalloendopeptidase